MNLFVTTDELRTIHQQLVSTDTLRPEDVEQLWRIFDFAPIDAGVTLSLLRAYYRDLDRADRTPRSLLYLHIGLILGALDLDPLPDPESA